MSSAIFEIRMIMKTKIFCAFASNKRQSFLALKPHCSVVYGTLVLCLFSKQSGKAETFSQQQLPKNDVFLTCIIILGNDAYQSGILNLSDLDPVTLSLKKDLKRRLKYVSFLLRNKSNLESFVLIRGALTIKIFSVHFQVLMLQPILLFNARPLYFYSC